MADVARATDQEDEHGSVTTYDTRSPCSECICSRARVPDSDRCADMRPQVLMPTPMNVEPSP